MEEDEDEEEEEEEEVEEEDVVVEFVLCVCGVFVYSDRVFVRMCVFVVLCIICLTDEG